MNRFARVGLYALFSIAIGLVVIGGQKLVMLPAVYDTIHQMGDRLGKVLPQGYSEQSRLGSADQSRSVTLVRTPQPVRRMYAPEADTAQSMSARAGVDLRVPIFVVALYFVALTVVSWVSKWKQSHTRTLRDSNRIPTGAFLGASMLGSGVCVLIATLYTASRVFWTGVDQAFVARSIIEMPGNSTIHIRSDGLLAMSQSQAIMLLIAMLMTAFPILYWIDARMLGQCEQDDSQNKRYPSSPTLLSRIYEHKLVDGYFSQRTIYSGCTMCYVLVIVFLWTAPWSTTMVRLMFN